MKCQEPGCDVEVSDLEMLIIHSVVHEDDAFRDAVVIEFFHDELHDDI